MAQQTAVEFLEKQLTLALGDELKSLRGLFVVAKEMEKQQIINADLNASSRTASGCDRQISSIRVKELAEEYYKVTFNK